MRYTYLFLLLLLAAQAGAKDFTLNSDGRTVKKKDVKPKKENRDEGNGIFFSYGVEGGYSHLAMTMGGATVNGNGYNYKGELGVKIEVRGKKAKTKTGLLSISVFGTQLFIKDKYTDAMGIAHSVNRTYTMAGVPISFTRLSYGKPHRVGYYWQVGGNVDFIYKVKQGSNVETNQYNNFCLEPSVSGGVSIHYRQEQTKDQGRHGRMLIGPYISAIVSNMYKDNGGVVNGYSAGVRYVYVFM